jgi:hypothetical protein
MVAAVVVFGLVYMFVFMGVVERVVFCLFYRPEGWFYGGSGQRCGVPATMALLFALEVLYVFIDGTIFVPLFLRARGARIASLTSFHATDVIGHGGMYDASMLRFGAPVVLQGCTLNGHVALPATKTEGVSLVTDFTEIGDNTVAHPAAVMFGGAQLGDQPGSVIQSMAAVTTAASTTTSSATGRVATPVGGVHSIESWARLPPRRGRPTAAAAAPPLVAEDLDEDGAAAPLLGGAPSRSSSSYV